MKTWTLKFLDATIGAAVCRILGPLVAARPLSHPTARSPRPSRILLIRPGGIGDMAILLPSIIELQRAFPETEIDIVCERRNVEVLSLINMEQHALVYDTNPLRFLLTLLGRKYDAALDLEQFHHFSAIFALLSRAPVRVGFKVNPHRNPLYTHLTGYDLDGQESVQFRRVLAVLIRDLPPQQNHVRLGIPPMSETLRSRMETFMHGSGYVVLHSSGRQRHKRWNPAMFADLARLLSKEFGLSPVFLGSARDRLETNEIMRTLGTSRGGAMSFAGSLSLRESCAVIAGASLFVGIDSGLAHLASAFNVPTVSLFGSSDPRKWGHEGDANAVVCKNLPCSPCCMFGYHRPCRTISCMQDITVEDVLTACRKVLSSPVSRVPTST